MLVKSLTLLTLLTSFSSFSSFAGIDSGNCEVKLEIPTGHLMKYRQGWDLNTSYVKFHDRYYKMTAQELIVQAEPVLAEKGYKVVSEGVTDFILAMTVDVMSGKAGIKRFIGIRSTLATRRNQVVGVKSTASRIPFYDEFKKHHPLDLIRELVKSIPHCDEL